ncbi:LLM class flavin-dependent oxidoreductase [Streptomyces sp. Da 82-17]|uniref:LLM class flavin-dependent oxidoreductase n=1 Tax=Streptomyces sp. Da 82-17 TaxID=3377116 RepID=UPI0038D4B520
MSALSDESGITKFVYWDNLTYSPPGSYDPEEWDAGLGARIYENYLDHCVEAEHLGYAGVSMPEHFGPSSPCPHPNIMMAALAARTTTARIISGANLPLLHHPLQLAEQLAMIDVLSGGRLEVGLGRHGDRAAQEHAIDLVDGGLNRFDLPVPKDDLTPMSAAFLADAETAEVTVWPRPVQQRVPLWVAAGSDESLATAARRGLGVFTGLNITPSAGGMAPLRVDEMAARLRRYVEIGQEHGQALSMAHVMASCFTVVAETDREAAEIVRDGFIRHVESAAVYLARMAGSGRLDSPLESLAEQEETGIRAVLETPADSYLRNPFALVGSVETVKEKLAALRAAGLTRFMLLCGGVGTEQAIGWQTAKAMAEDVAPELFLAARNGPVRMAAA